ncbi:hypothetical protein IWQ57_006384 [Coemansia nantahalensis]|uniref:Uncharacterized protein n=2 Tax=Coemansia TaxID=4863 RepID=A0ACC1LGM0_9FUNG|nr:hypothetical protein IWQ57_006384 [Coemansia nantahalensis]KAJ2808086.1 hypothetical protein H4R21_000216 [Coemansia helicoidea]
MGEKRKLKQGDAAAKKAKAGKHSKSGKSSSRTEEARTLIPCPAPVDGSSFSECAARLAVTLAPAHSRDHWAGIHETLNSMLLHFVPQIRGVVLAYSKVKVLSNAALMYADSPYGQLEISARLLLWRPVSGMTLRGTINVQSPDHIGLLLWDTFNASIPAASIPKTKYEWRPFSDEEVAARAVATSRADASEHDSDGAGSDTATDERAADSGVASAKFSSGEWVLKGTSQCVGTKGSLEFVVVDVIRADNVLSVTGALR